MLESTIVAAAALALNKIEGCQAQKIHGSAYGHPTLDLLVCYKGQMLWLEAKQPGKKATDRQEATMRKWRKAGCICGVFTSKQEALDYLEQVGIFLPEGGQHD